MVGRCSKVVIKGLEYKRILGFGNYLRLKCHNIDTDESFKFILPKGDIRIDEFLVMLHVQSTNDLWDREFQILYFKNHIYGISRIGHPDEVKYIPCTPANESLVTDPANKLMSYSALEALIADYSRNDKPYYVEMF